MRKDISVFYSTFAVEYDLIAGDRNFRKQTIAMIDRLEGECLRSIELFAATAKHSRVLQELGCDAFAFDSSFEMKQLALKSGFEPMNYVVSPLPDALSQFNLSQSKKSRFNLAICPRYSIGYLEELELSKLLKCLVSLMAPRGKLFLEVHDHANFDDCFNNLQIRERRVRLNQHEELICVWPSAPISLEGDGSQVTMEVTLTWERTGTEVGREVFVSTETLYTAEEIVAISQPLGWKVDVVTKEFSHDFFGCEVLELVADV